MTEETTTTETQETETQETETQETETQETETSYENELMADYSHYEELEGEWMPYRSRNRY